MTIYHGDALAVMPALEHGSVDVVVTDPPYGISDAPMVTVSPRGARRGGNNTYHPESTWDKEINPNWCRAVCAAAPVVVWCGHWSKRHAVETHMTWPIRTEIVWAKDMHTGPPAPVARQDERIWVFGEQGIKPRCFETSVWNVSVIPTWGHRHHRNEKPEALMLRLLRWAPGDVVLDPFMGSGTTLVAAKRLGRKAIGIELSEEYCEIAAKRLAQRALDFGAVS